MATRGKLPSHACPVSPGSIFDSSLHESIDTSVKGKRGRGRPRKVPTAPTYDDFPEHGTALEKKKWKMRKNAEEWWYKKLMSGEAEEYHEKEKQRVSKFQSEKRQEIIQGAQGQSEMYQYVGEQQDTPKMKAKEKSRIR